MRRRPPRACGAPDPALHRLPVGALEDRRPPPLLGDDLALVAPEPGDARVAQDPGDRLARPAVRGALRRRDAAPVPVAGDGAGGLTRHHPPRCLAHELGLALVDDGVLVSPPRLARGRVDHRRVLAAVLVPERPARPTRHAPPGGVLGLARHAFALLLGLLAGHGTHDPGL